MFSAPYAVGVKAGDGSVKNTGHLKPGGYNGFFSALRGQPGGWANLIQTRSDGTVLRALAPGHDIEAGALPLVPCGFWTEASREDGGQASGQPMVTPPATRPRSFQAPWPSPPCQA